MSLEDVDSFSAYSAAQATVSAGGPWSSVFNMAFSAGGSGRWGGTNQRYMELTQNTSYCERDFAALATRGVGIAVYAQSILTNAHPFLHFKDGSTTHITINITVLGEIEVLRGDGTQLGISAASLVASATWYFIETKVTIDNSAGAVEVRLNGTAVVTVTGADTRNGGNATTDRIRLQSVVANTDGFRTRFCDLVVWNTSGSINNDFMGDCRVEYRLPSAEGTTIDWTPSTGTNNAALVDEPGGPNDDSDYVESANPGDIDLYVMEDLASSAGSVIGAAIRTWAKKTDVGVREISLGVRSASTNDFGTAQALTSAYRFYSRLMELNPITGLPFTYADINALEVGQKVET